jgi:Sulfotransferase domain
VRDPRDVAVSSCHHNVKAGNIPDSHPMEQFTARLIAAEFDPKWGSWSDHVVSWLTLRRDRPGFVLLRYEDMKRDPAREPARLAAFLQNCGFGNIESTPEELEPAIDLSSPERMREIEKKQGRGWVLTKHTRADKLCIRTATAGGSKTSLSPPSVAMMESA